MAAPSEHGRSEASFRDGVPMFVVDGVTKSFEAPAGPRRALAEVSFTVDAGEFVSIVGPSGCGKSTLLGILSGLVEPSDGEVHLAGRKVSGPPEDLSLVFQDYSRSLFPWLRVHRNVELPLRSSRMPRSARAARVDRALEAVGLSGTGGLFPWQLSGGMQQRVAIARALVVGPRVTLMDEPFAAVDAQTRAGLEDLVLELWRQLDITVLFVTHDIDQAVYLSDRVLVMSGSPGHIDTEVVVPLPRPRHQLHTKEHPDYAHLRSKIFELVMRDDGTERHDTQGLRDLLGAERLPQTRAEEIDT